MKNFIIKRKKLAVLILLLFIGLAPLVSLAKSIESDNIYIPADAEINEPLFLTGASINIDGTVNDDIYAAGANIIISGPVNGDIIAIGSNIIINSDVTGDIRAAGAAIQINGKVSRNITIAGANITLGENSEIGKNIIFGAANGNINGKVNKNVYGGGANIKLNSDIKGNAYLGTGPDGEITLLSGTNIAGNLEYTAPQTADIQAGAKIGQEEIYSQISEKAAKVPPKPNMGGFLVIAWLISLFGALITGLILVIVLKKFTLQTQKIIAPNIKKVLYCLLIGFIYIIITPIILLILMITGIGLPLAFILLGLYLISIYIAKIFVGVYIGDKVIKYFNKDSGQSNLIGAMSLGVVIIYLVAAIPILGWVIRFIITLWGLGMLVMVLKNKLEVQAK